MRFEIARAWARVGALWRSITRRDHLDAEMRDEIRFHIDEEAARLVRAEGLDPREARRRALVAFGGVEKYREAAREVRGLPWIDAIALDTRLGARMLVKHRGLTIAGGLAMAVAIAVGAVFFEVFGEVLDPALPFDGGARIVAVHYATPVPGSAERRVLRDFADWRETLTTVEHLGVFRTVQRNLVAEHALPEPVRLAEITSSAFAMAHTPPHAGRYLQPADEDPGAAPVVVIGHQAWQSRFGGDTRLIGRPIALGGVPHTVVGIMPGGFAFPIDHQFWIPLRENPHSYARREGPEVFVFGRLAPGVSLEQSQAELAAAGRSAAAAYPETHRELRLVVLPYTHEALGVVNPSRAWLLRIAALLAGALAVVVAVNLAILIYARTMTRLGEIVVRSALGASRARILAQLFLEALVLTLAGAAAGLMLAAGALGRMQALVVANGSVPFWIDLRLSFGTVAYAIGLAVMAAAIMGALPGLKATGRGLTVTLRELNDPSGRRLGKWWTTLVVAQVGAAVAVLPAAVYLSWQAVRMELTGPGFAAGQFVVGTFVLGDESADTDRATRRQIELLSRLEAEPGVAAVTFSSSVPGFAPGRRLEFENGARTDSGPAEASTIEVDAAMFRVYGAAILAGRGFDAADAAARNAVVVNRTFVRRYLDDRAALGVRIRYLPAPTASAAADRWYDIVGVVNDFPGFSPAPGSDGEPTVYHAAAPAGLNPAVLSVRFRGAIPPAFIDRFRTIAAEVDPAVQLRRVVPLSAFYDDVRSVWRYLAWGVGLATASVLLLSAAGMYALMSLAVAQRTREIGIRTALGAPPRRILWSVFGRAAGQLALGVLCGSLVSAGALTMAGLDRPRAAGLLMAVAAIMMIVGLLAALGPALRGLRVNASEALRADA